MPHKTLRRFHGYDYARGGSMFVTIAVNREVDHRFGKVDHDRINLNESGEIVSRDLSEAANRFSGFITLRTKMIMPNHVHARFTWPAGNADALKEIGRFIGRFKQFAQYHVAGHGPHLWQDGYHDILCVSERCNRTVDAYIANNPLKWWLMYCDKSLMHVEEPFYLPDGVGGNDLWRAVGNFDLLESPRLVSLRISQKVPESRLREVVDICVRGAVEKGYIYLSTFFSPGERAVFKALSALEKPAMIRFISTYLDLAYRPHGSEPLLFNRKRLLILSRMPDPDAEPRRGELVGLNFTAADLARASKAGKAVYIQYQDGRIIYGQHPVA